MKLCHTLYSPKIPIWYVCLRSLIKSKSSIEIKILKKNSVTHRHSHKFGSQFGGYFRQFSWHHWPIPVIFLWAGTGIQTWLRITSWALPNGLVLSRVNTALGAGLFNCTFGGCPKWLIILISAQFLKVSWSPHPIAPVPLPQRAHVLPKVKNFLDPAMFSFSFGLTALKLSFSLFQIKRRQMFWGHFWPTYLP